MIGTTSCIPNIKEISQLTKQCSDLQYIHLEHEKIITIRLQAIYFSHQIPEIADQVSFGLENINKASTVKPTVPVYMQVCYSLKL
jgi:hypothetical protein